MEFRGKSDITLYFKNQRERNDFVQLMKKEENELDWHFTVHGESGVPNSHYVKLYQLNRNDLLVLSALLFALDVDSHRRRPKRKDK